jgi:hypothetical protein
MFPFRSVPPEGRIAIVTKRGMECDGRDGVGREERCRAGIPERVLREQSFRVHDTTLTASSHGLDGEHTPAVEGPAEMCADGEVVWSWRPKLASSPWRRFTSTDVRRRKTSARRGWQ